MVHKKVYLILTLTLTLPLFAISEERTKVAWYNCENFFDTLPNPLIQDEAYTPQSTLRWDSQKYNRKTTHIAQVLDDLNADLVGLCEIENEAVVRDLVYAIRTDYNYIHRHTGDRRGIDLVLLYRPTEFEPTEVRQISGPGLTREALFIRGELHGETIHLLLCHLPSVLSPSEQRNQAARTLRRCIDSLQHHSPNILLLVMGDFNTVPASKLSRKAVGVLSTHSDTLLAGACSRGQAREASSLSSPFLNLHRQGYGSYVYRDQWFLYDYITLSSSYGEHYTIPEYGIFSRDYLLHSSGPKRSYPFRTFNSGNYLGGYSDHLPVFMTLQKRVAPECREDK